MESEAEHVPKRRTLQACRTCPRLERHAIATPTITRRALQRCTAIFCERHLTCTFCSFIHRPDLDALSASPSSFLALVIVCLCSRYLSTKEAEELFGPSLSSGWQVCRRFTPAAKALARSTMDDPSVLHIQANLVLAVSELLNNEGSSHWMYAGTAIRMAQVMRLNQDYHQQHSLPEQEIRRRTFWACFSVDKLLAFLLTKPGTLALGNVAVALPSTDAALAYGEATRGLTLGSSFEGAMPSQIGLLPYFLKTLTLWSNIVDRRVCHSRFVTKTLPTDPAGRFYQSHQALHDWDSQLPAGLQWTPENRANHHTALNQGRTFVAMHFLIRSAFCVAHEAYLPQLDGSSVLVNAVDAAGWSLLHREPSLLAQCVTSALAVGVMLAEVEAEKGGDGDDDGDTDMLQSVWVASALLSVSNTLLWLQYAHDPDYADDQTVDKARHYWSMVTRRMQSWAKSWKAARQWLKGLHGMQALYRAAYLGEVEDEEAATGDVSSGDEIDGDSETPSFRPRAGDGYPPLTAIPNLYASLRFLASDTSAEPKRLQSVWMSFVSGWSFVNLTNPDMNDNPFAQLAQQR
ncbi:hypothetical protein Sste5344_004093 [Sporothrix stenoceras]